MVEIALCPVTVGRESEARRLAEALDAARSGQSRTVVVTGDAGLGKTRLAGDLRRVAGELDVATMWGGCAEAELSLPYLPFLEAIGNHLAQADLTALRPRVAANRELAFALFVNHVHLDKAADTSRVGKTLGRLCEVIYTND